MKFTLFLAAALLGFQALALQHAPSIAGIDLLTGQKIEISGAKNKGLVLVFLSATCPCSNSHVKELSELRTKYTDFSFLAVHSNADESAAEAKTYFTAAKLPFPVIRDENTKIADQFKALKTPHAFLIRPNGEIAYRGGVSNSRNCDASDKKYLREALEDLQADRPVRTAEARTLGCEISRGSKNVW